MKQFLLLAPLLAMCACATYAWGEDPKGIQLQITGAKVLQAARAYMDETGKPPRNLQVLVPGYLDALPTEPAIQYDAKNATYFFEYTQEGRNGLPVLCHALIGQTGWVCTGVYH